MERFPRVQTTLPDGFLLTIEDRRGRAPLFDPAAPYMPEVVLTLERSGIESELRLTDMVWRDVTDPSVFVHGLVGGWVNKLTDQLTPGFRKAAQQINEARL